MVSNEEEIYLRQCDVWERSRRNPKYLSVCNTLEFDERGYYIEINRRVLKGSILAITFPGGNDLHILIDPSKEFDKILKEMPLRVGDITIGLAFKPEFPVVEPKFDQELGPSTYLPRDGKYMTFEIDITQNYKDIQSQLFGFIKLYRKLYGIKTIKGGETFKKRFEYYDVWDQRKEKQSFKDIALKNKKYREEPFEVALDRIKKQFYKAYELITGERYDKNIWEKLLPPEEEKQKHLLAGQIEYSKYGDGVSNELESDPMVRILLQDIAHICEECSDIDCRNVFFKKNYESWDPCPEILTYLTD